MNVVLLVGQHWNLVAIGLGHYIFGETGAMKLKDGKASISPSQHPLPSPVFLSLHLSVAPLLSYRSPSTPSHWIKFGPFSPLRLAHSVVIWKKKDLKLVSAEGRARSKGKEAGFKLIKG